MASPLRHRSPVKDQEVGPTPNKTGKTPGSAAVSPALPQGVAPAAGVGGFIANHKKLLILLAVAASIVIIAVSVSSSKSSGANASNSASRSSSQDGINGGKNGNGNGNGKPTTGTGKTNPDDDAGLYDDLPDAPTSDPTLPTEAPTAAPTPMPTIAVPPLATEVCYVSGNIGNANWYNAIFFNSFWSNGSAVEGRLAVGNTCWVNRFSVGQYLYGGVQYSCPNLDFTSMQTAANYAMVVQGSLFMNGTAVANGGVSYGSIDFVDEFNVARNCPSTQGSPSGVNLGSIQSQLQTASSAISGMSKSFSRYTISASRQTLTFNLNGSIMTESFNVLEKDLKDAVTIEVKGTPKTYNGETATIIFNVIKPESNTDGVFRKSQFAFHNFNDVITTHSIWNFAGYNTIIIDNGNWYGSILALDASFENTVGNLWGGIYANSWNTGEVTMDMKFHSMPFMGRVFSTCE